MRDARGWYIHQIFKNIYMMQLVEKYSLLNVYQLYNVP
jgi:hypothetical protein